jgi:hypothetical protein
MQKLTSIFIFLLVSTSFATPQEQAVGEVVHDEAYRAWFFGPEQRLKVQQTRTFTMS